ncbi:MAG: hypothetical protein HOG95_15655 [Rhodospirillaceae bacterium]|jgi:hypothetical protein|nr:hypothetical protein [Rhodospirillaceae bacterium]MBT4589138.1 hypothetical protein [Rhodospirillaceae bacterium]MBT5941366.1 hypothetical protein [Rhodospirillaceae bacterium]MBT7268523.1 hypothetical protein [Rhodospirillaceae bacterium]
MKVSKTRTAATTPTKKARKTEATSGTAFASHLEGVKQTSDDVAPVGEVSGVSAVGSILAAQEVGDDDGNTRQLLQKYGEDVLDRLDEIQRDLLAGSIPKDRLTNLAQTLRAKKKTIDDPSLLRIISDIELRAEVELAKYTRKI